MRTARRAGYLLAGGLVSAAAVACSAAAPSGSASAPSAAGSRNAYVQEACDHWATARPLVARLLALDAEFAGGERVGAIAEARTLGTDAAAVQWASPSPDPATPQLGLLFADYVYQVPGMIQSHADAMINGASPADVEVSESAAVGVAGWADGLARGSGGRAALCPELPIPSRYPGMSLPPGIAVPSGLVLP